MYYFIIDLKIVAPSGHSFAAHRAIKNIITIWESQRRAMLLL